MVDVRGESESVAVDIRTDHDPLKRVQSSIIRVGHKFPDRIPHFSPLLVRSREILSTRVGFIDFTRCIIVLPDLQRVFVSGDTTDSHPVRDPDEKSCFADHDQKLISTQLRIRMYVRMYALRALGDVCCLILT